METLIAAYPPVAWAALLTVGRAEASILIASTTAAAAHSRAGTADRELVVGADAPGGIALFCVATPSFPALLVAPIAARWSSRAPVSVLRRLFAPRPGVIAARLLLIQCT